MAKNRGYRWGPSLTIVGVLLLAAAGGASWRYRTHAEEGPKYTTEKVGRGDLTQTVTATGTLNPVVNVTVGSQVSGRVCKLYVDYNSTVKSNQILRVSPPPRCFRSPMI